eukprot:g11828.t1
MAHSCTRLQQRISMCLQGPSWRSEHCFPVRPQIFKELRKSASQEGCWTTRMRSLPSSVDCSERLGAQARPSYELRNFKSYGMD